MERGGQSTAEKRDTLLSLLERGLTMLHVDARRTGVQVPSQFSGDFHLRLNLSYRFYLPDLEITEWGVQATLSFGGNPHRCRLPWSAVWAMTRHEEDVGWVWPLDMPPEIASQLGTATTDINRELSSADANPQTAPPEAVDVAGPRKGPALMLVPDVSKGGEPAAESDEPDTPSAPPNLRLLK